jgi:hypothetical protein
MITNVLAVVGMILALGVLLMMAASSVLPDLVEVRGHRCESGKRGVVS